MYVCMCSCRRCCGCCRCCQPSDCFGGGGEEARQIAKGGERKGKRRRMALAKAPRPRAAAATSLPPRQSRHCCNLLPRSSSSFRWCPQLVRTQSLQQRRTQSSHELRTRRQSLTALQVWCVSVASLYHKTRDIS